MYADSQVPPDVASAEPPISTITRPEELQTRNDVREIGGLLFLSYNAVVFAFDIAFNSFFLVYVAQLSLAVWATIAVALHSRDRLPDFAIGRRARRRFVGGYLVAMALLWAAIWLRDIVAGLVMNRAPAGPAGTRMLTNPFEVMDLAFTLPLAALSGVWVWRRKPRDALVGGALLTFLSIAAISVAVDQTLGNLADPTQPLTAVPLMAGLTVVGLFPTVSLFRAIKGPAV